MADGEAVFVKVWTERWSKILVPLQFTSAGAIRRLNVGALLGKTMPSGAEAGSELIDGIFSDLRSMLKEGATFWSSGPGMISIFYPKMGAQAADLAHSVIASTVDRRVRETVIVPARGTAKAASNASTERQVGWEELQSIVRRAKARPEQIQTIDISELVLGRSDPTAYLSKRAWRLVDEVVNDFLGAGGYWAKQAGNQILLFFPGLSASLARLKRKAIVAEIEASIGVVMLPAEGIQSPDDAEGGAPVLSKKKRPQVGTEESVEEIAHLNRAFAALASPSAAAEPEEHPSAVIMQKTPVWRAGSQTLVGYTLSVRVAPGAIHIPIDLLDLTCLARAHAETEDGVSAQSPHLVVARLHWHTLERAASRSRYQELASKLPEAARRFLVLSLCDVPEDLLTARIEDRMRELRPYCRSMTFRTEIDRADFQQVKGLDLHAVGVELRSPGGGESDMMLAMNTFMKRLAPFQTKAFIDGLTTKSLVVAAIAAGFDYLSGPAIVEAPGTTQGVKAFSIADLYIEQDDESTDAMRS
ncbi:MAG TPA: hypothetical protein VGG27_17140 [Magnetospirillaceae bacterium]|jgi:hypothetical protein